MDRTSSLGWPPGLGKRRTGRPTFRDVYKSELAHATAGETDVSHIESSEPPARWPPGTPSVKLQRSVRLHWMKSAWRGLWWKIVTRLKETQGACCAMASQTSTMLEELGSVEDLSTSAWCDLEPVEGAHWYAVPNSAKEKHSRGELFPKETSATSGPS